VADALRPRIGRPTKCTPQTTEAICAQLRTGLPLTIAAAAEGVTSPDLAHWRRSAADGDEPFATFFTEVARAEAQGIAGLYGEVRRESKPGPEGERVEDWKARVRLLESVSRDQFGQSVAVVVKAQAEASQEVLDVARRVLPPEHFAALMAALSEDDDAPADGAEVQH